MLFKSPALSPHFRGSGRVFFLFILFAAAGYMMQPVTPSVVPMAVRMVTSVWMTSFQMLCLFMIFVFCR